MKPSEALARHRDAIREQFFLNTVVQNAVVRNMKSSATQPLPPEGK
jgi:hypothetical protein